MHKARGAHSTTNAKSGALSFFSPRLEGSILLRTQRKALLEKHKWDLTALWTVVQSLDARGIARGLGPGRPMS